MALCVCVCVQEKQEALEAASDQLKKEKAGHEERYRDLLVQLELLRTEKREADREIGRFRASLKGIYIFRTQTIL